MFGQTVRCVRTRLCLNMLNVLCHVIHLIYCVVLGFWEHVTNKSVVFTVGQNLTWRDYDTYIYEFFFWSDTYIYELIHQKRKFSIFSKEHISFFLFPFIPPFWWRVISETKKESCTKRPNFVRGMRSSLVRLVHSNLKTLFLKKEIEAYESFQSALGLQCRLFLTVR